MRYRLFGNGFEAFLIDKHLVGVTAIESKSQQGQYLVKEIFDVAQYTDGLSLLVELLDNDEHLPAGRPTPEVADTVLGPLEPFAEDDGIPI